MPIRTFDVFFSGTFTGKHKKFRVSVVVLAWLLTICLDASAQRFPARNVVWEAKLQRQVSFLADSLCNGRGTGTSGGTEAAFFILRRFREAGLEPMCGSGDAKVYAQSFRTESGAVGHNVIGFMNGSKKIHKNEYIVVGAHFDHLGHFGGKMYPGADDNASGIVAAISLAEMFRMSKIIGKAYFKNVIFVAFDAKEKGMAGSQAFWTALENGKLHDPATGKTILPEMVSLMVNIDQIGCSLSPLASGREDYLLAVDGGTFGSRESELLDWCNNTFGTNLELCHSYYGSANFTKVFFKITDQNIFAQHKIPSVLFTSGITMNNYKSWDTAETLNYEVLKRRIWLIWHWLEYQLY